MKREWARSQSLPKESVNAYRDEAAAFVSGAGALKRYDSIAADGSGGSGGNTKSDMVDMLDEAAAMSLDDKELAAAAEEARQLMEENSRVRR